MNKYRKIIFRLTISFVMCLSLSGCSKSADSQDQEVSALVDITPASAITEIPTVTQVPAVTPAITKKPTVTLAPTVTPVITKKPTVTLMPTVTPVITKKPTVTLVPSITLVPAITSVPILTPVPVITPIPAITSAPTVTQTPDDFVAKLDLQSDVNQLVCVIGSGGSDCIVSFHIKDKDGNWSQQFSTDGECGSKGITYHKKEGDGKTPAGIYSFTMAFGIKSDPGAKLLYRQVTKYDYWIDDIKSLYYNTWVNSKEIPGDYTSEHLIDHAPQYNYALNINYNPDCIPGSGSAIFLHGFNGLGHTTGCIAISEKYVKTLLQNLDSTSKIIIVPTKDDLANYE